MTKRKWQYKVDPGLKDQQHLWGQHQNVYNVNVILLNVNNINMYNVNVLVLNENNINLYNVNVLFVLNVSNINMYNVNVFVVHQSVK